MGYSDNFDTVNNIHWPYEDDQYIECLECGLRVRRQLIKYYKGWELCSECYENLTNGDN